MVKYRMVVQPHYTIPVNVRPRDTPTIQAAKEIAQRENKQMTTIFREALAEYVDRRKLSAGSFKLEQYIGSESVTNNGSLEKVLVPGALKLWGDSELLSFAKKLRARTQEIDAELRRRGYYFKW
jgi:hypothetical protein